MKPNKLASIYNCSTKHLLNIVYIDHEEHIIRSTQQPRNSNSHAGNMSVGRAQEINDAR